MKRIAEKDYLEELHIIRNTRNIFIILLIIWLGTVLVPIEILVIILITAPSNINNNSLFIILVLQGMVPFLGLFPLIRIITQYPIYRVNLLINKEKIEVNFRDHLYFKELWKNVKKVEIINERSYLSQSKNFYRLKLIKEKETKDLILYLLRLKTVQTKKIILTIENISKNFNIPFEKRSQWIDGYYGKIYKEEISVIKKLNK